MSFNLSKYLALFVLTALVGALGSLAFGQSSNEATSQNLEQGLNQFDQHALAIADKLRCPTCQGISVNDSEAVFSVQIRAKIKELLKAGQDEEEIIAFFVSRYGEWILRSPPARGLYVLLWVMPVVLLAIGGVTIVYFTRKRSKQQSYSDADFNVDA